MGIFRFSTRYGVRLYINNTNAYNFTTIGMNIGSRASLRDHQDFRQWGILHNDYEWSTLDTV